jgi:diaminopimelate epimerase
MKTAYKFHGAGNDFIIVDCFEKKHLLTANNIKFLCDRHFGIGADGLIIIEKSDKAAFKMVYFNSDGNEAEMCGNGARCAFAFASSKQYCKNPDIFEAGDGIHNGKLISKNKNEWVIRITLKLNSAPKKISDGSYFVDTGVPHNVRVVKNVDKIEVKKEGAILRFNKSLFPNGANINFVAIKENELFIRTYERGVEDETLACGTGITASALVVNKFLNIPFPVKIHALGGNLTVEKENDLLWLEGPATHVFTLSYF